jgi:AraC-like DNA-binding protein
MRAGERMRAWRPALVGVHEVLHADFIEHAYPPHTHDEWTLLLLDVGEVAYAMDGAPRRAPAGTVSLLPPHVAHDGRSAAPGGFRKRVVYLDADWLPADLVGASVDRPVLPELTAATRALHAALLHPGDELGAEAVLARIRERTLGHLTGSEARVASAPALAALLRELLDAHTVTGLTLADAARTLETTAGALARSFQQAYGISPHRYLVGRRVDRARHLLTDGWPPADAAIASGFFDQAHLTRHFARVLGITPAAYARGKG